MSNHALGVTSLEAKSVTKILKQIINAMTSYLFNMYSILVSFISNIYVYLLLPTWCALKEGINKIKNLM